MLRMIIELEGNADYDSKRPSVRVADPASDSLLAGSILIVSAVLHLISL